MVIGKYGKYRYKVNELGQTKSKKCLNSLLFFAICLQKWNLPIADIPNSGHAMNNGQNFLKISSQ